MVGQSQTLSDISLSESLDPHGVFTDVSSELLLFMQLLIHASRLIFLINLMHTIYLPYLMLLIRDNTPRSLDVLIIIFAA